MSAPTSTAIMTSSARSTSGSPHSSPRSDRSGSPGPTPYPQPTSSAPTSSSAAPAAAQAPFFGHSVLEQAAAAAAATYSSNSGIPPTGSYYPGAGFGHEYSNERGGGADGEGAMEGAPGEAQELPPSDAPDPTENAEAGTSVASPLKSESTSGKGSKGKRKTRSPAHEALIGLASLIKDAHPHLQHHITHTLAHSTHHYGHHGYPGSSYGVNPYPYPLPPNGARGQDTNGTPYQGDQGSPDAAAAAAAIQASLAAQQVQQSHSTGSQPKPNAPVKRFQCPKCTRAFARAYNLNTHLNTHETDPNRSKPFTCPYPTCKSDGGRSFSRKHDLQRHIASVHEFEAEPGIYGDGTGPLFAGGAPGSIGPDGQIVPSIGVDGQPIHAGPTGVAPTGGLQSLGLGSPGKKFRCEKCGRAFVRRDALRRHADCSGGRGHGQHQQPHPLQQAEAVLPEHHQSQESMDAAQMGGVAYEQPSPLPADGEHHAQEDQQHLQHQHHAPHDEHQQVQPKPPQ